MAPEKKDFNQTVYNEDLSRDMEALIAIAIREDSQTDGDLTSLALIPDDVPGRAAVVGKRASSPVSFSPNALSKWSTSG